MRDDGRNHPPRWIDRLLEWFCADEFLEIVQGDLHELYRQNVAEFGKQKADSQYLLDVLSLFRPFALGFTLPDLFYLTSSGMYKNYLLIAFRNLWNNKVYSLINVLGLALGTVAALYIFQYVQYERSYDSFHKDADNIHRVIFQATINGALESPQHNHISTFAPAIKKEIPEVVEYARLTQNWKDNFVFSYDTSSSSFSKEFSESKVYYAEASFMKMFSFPMVVGDPVAGLEEPNSMLLSERLAQKLLGPDWKKSDPIGKMVSLNGKDNFMIKGVFEDVPENSHIKFEALLSLTTLAESLDYDTRGNGGFSIYLQLDPRADLKTLESKLAKVNEKYFGELMQRNNINDANLSLQPIREAHLYSFGFKKEPEVRGSATTVQFLSIIACIVIVLAWINYVNLSTARAVKRAKEVGIRKVVGARRQHLVSQFLLEAFLINLLGLIAAIVLYYLCYPYFTSLVQKEITISSLWNESWISFGIALALIFGILLSGGYSAFVLSSFKAVAVMKGKFYTSFKGILLRKSLIVFQFVISVGLLAGTFVVYQQLDFMKNYQMGFDMKQKLIVRAPSMTDSSSFRHYENFKTTLEGFSQIDQITVSHLSPGDKRGKGDVSFYNKKQPEARQVFSLNIVDYDYLKTYEVELLHGRGFSRDFPADKNAAVISEDVALELGFNPAESALQEDIIYDLGKEKDGLPFKVIGIVKNINLYSLKLERTGVVFLLSQTHQEIGSWHPFNYFTLEINNTSDLPETIAGIEDQYRKIFPGNPFSYFFLDDYFNAQYQAEEQYGKLFTVASILAICIACLGLFGLSAFMVRQRTKEIGIRKVMGAPVKSVLLLLSGNYIKLVFLASLIALPLAYLSLDMWLESYMYRIQLSWWLFLIPMLLVLFIALFTVSYQTIKAALSNPVNSLKHE